jgi:hypothetical protein
MKSHKKIEDKYKNERKGFFGGGFSRNGEFLIMGKNEGSTLFLFK